MKQDGDTRRRWSRTAAPRAARWLGACLAGCVLAVVPHARPAGAADAVTEWTLEADRLGRGGANWRTLAIMHMALHDAVNAAQPRYARWAPPGPEEPAIPGPMLEAALAGAAAQVLVDLHPNARAEIGTVFQAALRRLPPGPGIRDGLALGEAIGRAAVARRAEDGYGRVRRFVGRDAPGRWRPAPPDHATSNTTDAVPFLFAARDWPGARPPPPPGSAAFLRDVAETRLMGAAQMSGRTDGETYAAVFWAYQSSQRGFVLLAVKLLDSDPLPGGLPAHARFMSQLAAAMADAAVLTWAEKERAGSWRPITVIQGGFGVRADPAWQPLVETPPHPEYPSGHAADCFTGAAMLAAAFGPDLSPVPYVAQSAMAGANADAAEVGMGQHAQPGGLASVGRPFPSFAAAAAECAESRIWAGAHFRSANEESHRLADAIAARALAALPPLSAAGPR